MASRLRRFGTYQLQLLAGLCAASIVGVTSAQSHAWLDLEEAKSGTKYEAVINLPHGCEGLPTDAVSVKVPSGLIVRQPPVADGWEVTGKMAEFDTPMTADGKTFQDGIVQLKWSGGTIADDEVGQIRFSGHIAEEVPTGENLYFLVVQHCNDKAERWIQIPKPGQDLSDLDAPAPFVTIIDSSETAHMDKTGETQRKRHNVTH